MFQTTNQISRFPWKWNTKYDMVDSVGKQLRRLNMGFSLWHAGWSLRLLWDPDHPASPQRLWSRRKAQWILTHARWQCWMNSRNGAKKTHKLEGSQSNNTFIPSTCLPTDLMNDYTICPRTCTTKKKCFASAAHILLNCRLVQKTVRTKGTPSKQKLIWKP